MKLLRYFHWIYWLYVYIPAAILSALIYVGYLRVSGDIQVCRLYYPEMDTAACYFSSKTVRTPGAK